MHPFLARPTRPEKGEAAMGVVIPFPQATRIEAQLVVRLWELVASGQRDSEAYRCLEAEIRRLKAMNDEPRHIRAARWRR
jgi:hypothetical protein